MQQTRCKFLGLWLLFGTVAALVCMSFWPAAHLGQESLPVTIDSFYHARRILDTAADPAVFYEFDSKIHAPEGSLLCWPWGYDYALAWLVRLAGKVGIGGPPIAFLIWIPVASVFLSVGLMMLIARRLMLSTGLMSIAALCVALSPLTVFLHAIGMIDHHYAEYIFVLATLAFGLTWFSNPPDARAAIVLGVILGIAPAIHNGLFILQIPVLATLLLLWLQGIRFPLRTIAPFCCALLGATIAILIPSLPVRLGRFEFYTLSWFHLYIACATAGLTFLLAYMPKSSRNLGILALVGLLLLLPLGRQLLLAQSFLVGTIKRLDAITEMQSVRQLAGGMDGFKTVSTRYSLLVWLTPVTAGYCLYRAWVERASGRLFFWVSSILGLVMLVVQFRLHYFGSFALFLPWLVLTQSHLARTGEHRRRIMLGASLTFVLAFAMSVRYFLLGPPAVPAADPDFAALRPILETLKENCAREPGVVLADNDAGHYIRYYTECSVIANNFLLTRQHEEKIRLIDQLTALPARALPDAAPYVRYVLLRPISVFYTAQHTLNYMTYTRDSARLLNDLLIGADKDIPANYVLLNQATMTDSQTHESFPLIRLYKVLPPR